ncbi:hypothetical protein HKX48_008344 [Thoreauomyces humboldtii]|nr:hypothetical protein HKX48_008344 [Thoreauomyces humboldtii]
MTAESSQLAKCLARQGIKLHIRSEMRRNQNYGDPYGTGELPPAEQHHFPQHQHQRQHQQTPQQHQQPVEQREQDEQRHPLGADHQQQPSQQPKQEPGLKSQGSEDEPTIQQQQQRSEHPAVNHNGVTLPETRGPEDHDALPMDTTGTTGVISSTTDAQ